MEDKFERVLVCPDVHAPYVDSMAFNAFLKFAAIFKPHILFIIGDFVDMYQVSSFDRDPNRRFKLWEDLTSGYSLLGRLRRAVGPGCKIYYLRGNHEFRMQRFLWRVAPELISLPSLEVPKLLNLDDFNIKWVEEGSMLYHGVLFKHGNIVRSRAGYTATGELEKSGISGVSGHTHRLAQVYKRNYGGTWTWLESGCLCDLNPEYAEGQMLDWCHGLVYGYFNRQGKSFELDIAHIRNGEVLWQGREIIYDSGSRIESNTPRRP